MPPDYARVWQSANPPIVLRIEGNRELYFACKRFVDVVLSGLMLILLAPLMGLIAIAVKLDSPGPIFFFQDRVSGRRRTGRNSTAWEVRTFRFPKFRTMVANADPSLHVEHIRAFVRGDLAGAVGNGGRFKLANDPRVTRLGRLLRRTSLDELPQLFTILTGDMSLVGPRPVPIYEAAEYKGSERERMAAMPGLTGLWQVKGRTDVSFAGMIQMDREYVRTQSLWVDFKILMATIPAVLSGRGAC